MQGLEGKAALVTGGARRIGREVALALARAGADVTLTFRQSSDEAAQLLEQIGALGRRAQAVECDVRSEASIACALEAVTQFHRRLDVVVNNAAVFHQSPLEELTVEQWDEVFAVNARGPFLVARAVLPLLRSAHGRVVNIGSLGGEQAWATHAHYCASKAALHALTRSMAKAWAPEISVNCVAPGWVEMAGDYGEVAARSAARTPMRRNGAPADIAEAVLYFATASSFVTGQVLMVDGGLGL